MGYGIIYVPLSLVRRRVNAVEKDGDVEQEDPYYEFSDQAEGESYLSYNFSKFKQYAYLPDIAGQTTEVIAEQLSDVLKVLLEQKHYPEIPSETCEVKDNDGVTHTKPMDGWTPDIRVFAYHVKRLISECQKYKKCVMLLDYTHSLKLTEEDLVEEEDQEVDASELKLEREHLPEIYYRHPIKGNVRVDNFALCTEIYVMARSKDDPRASQWYDLCWTMPDAPPRPQISGKTSK
jgi:hypothetical protein